jgi:hypothetical protein
MIERCDPVKHLYIAMPAYGGMNAVQTTTSLVGATMVCTKFLNVEMSFKCEPGDPYLDHVRNKLVTGFLQSDATDLLFVDADVGFEPRAAAQICRATRPFIGGLYPLKQDGDTAFPADFNAAEFAVDGDGFVDALDMLPTGFLRLNRAVFDLMPFEWYEFGGRRTMGYFHSHVGQGGDGEDVDFCKRWRGLGGKIHLIPNLTFEHVGPKAWKANWAESHAVQRHPGATDPGISRRPL